MLQRKPSYKRTCITQTNTAVGPYAGEWLGVNNRWPPTDEWLAFAIAAKSRGNRNG